MRLYAVVIHGIGKNGGNDKLAACHNFGPIGYGSRFRLGRQIDQRPVFPYFAEIKPAVNIY